MEGGITHYTILGTLGSTGLGLVWGWLIGSLKGRVYRLRSHGELLGYAQE